MSMTVRRTKPYAIKERMLQMNPFDTYGRNIFFTKKISLSAAFSRLIHRYDDKRLSSFTNELNAFGRDNSVKEPHSDNREEPYNG